MKAIVLLVVSIMVHYAYSQEVNTYEQDIPGTTITFKMAAIPAGKFTMGSAPTEKGRGTDEGPQKSVAISSFWIGIKEVTFAEWDLYFKDVTLPQAKNLDGVTRATPQYIDLTWGMGRDGKHPVNSMSHAAALMYCKWLYTKTDIFFRLPTEAEWEYACRASATANPLKKGENNLKEYGYFKENSNGKFHHVGQLKPNAWGLYDMLGNLSEWTMDQYDPVYYEKISERDPLSAPATKYPKTVRGGSYQDEGKELRCANRLASDAKWNQRDPQIPKSKWWLTDGMFVGFRLVRPSTQPSKEEIEEFFALYLK